MWVGTSVPYLSPRTEGRADARSEEAATSGQSGTQKLREVAETVPPPDVAKALNLASSETAVVRRRAIFLDDRPVELADSWYPAGIANDTALAESQKIRGGAVTLLAELGYVAHEAREEIAFRPATVEETIDLDVNPGAPVIVLTRIVLTADEVPFEVSVMTMVANGRRLRYRLVVG